MSSGGRIVIPAEMRKQLEVEPGDEVLMRMKDGELVVYTRLQALRRIQQRMREAIPEGVSLVDELIAERRREAANE